MMYKAKVAVCSEILAKHSSHSLRHVEFLNVKTWWYVKKPLGFKRLIWGTVAAFAWRVWKLYLRIVNGVLAEGLLNTSQYHCSWLDE